MLNEYIVAGTPKDDFRNRLKAVLTGTVATATPAASVNNSGNNATEAAPSPSAQPTPASAPPPTQPAQSATQEAKAESNPGKETEESHADAPRKPGHRISKEQAEARAQRHKEERERASAAMQEPKVETKPEETETGHPDAPRKPGHRISREQAESRIQRHKEERELKAENEETETTHVDAPKKPGHRISREQAESRAQRHREEREQAHPNASATAAVEEAPKSAERPHHQAPTHYRLQIRLFDGSSVRSSFSPTDTITDHVRPWLDEQRSDGDRPYTLKHILAPLPNHTISVAEEGQTLQELSLGPTANLVMVPVQSYTEAYASSAVSFPIRGLCAGYNLVSSVVGAVTGTIGSLLGYGGSQTASTNDDSTSASPASSQRPGNGAARPRNTGGINIRTLRDQRDERRDHQFYNGNQVC